jgi:hypothetical protein
MITHEKKNLFQERKKTMQLIKSLSDQIDHAFDKKKKTFCIHLYISKYMASI